MDVFGGQWIPSIIETSTAALNILMGHLNTHIVYEIFFSSFMKNFLMNILYEYSFMNIADNDMFSHV